MRRIHSIDYLRGLMALAVLIYHFASWSVGVPDSGTVLGRLGIYAVSIFFIISGMSLYLAYSNRTWGGFDVLTFIKKRYLRLVPAFWGGCLLVTALFFYTNDSYFIDWEKLVYNLSLLFGFVSPRNYLTAGGWSIGNEMVFYFFFPFVMWFSVKRKESIMVALIMTFIAFLYYAFYRLDPSKSLAAQWSYYIEPFNNAFLFFLGVFIAWVSSVYELSAKQKTHRVVLFFGVVLFALYPASGNQINIVTGVERISFTIICGALCFSILNIKFNLNHAVASIFKILGDISYTIYMFHGVLAAFTIQVIAPALGVTAPEYKLGLLMFLTLPVTLVFSYFFFNVVEVRVMNLGKRKTASLVKA